MIITIIAASVAPLPARSDALDTARFLACIAAIEGHRWTDAGGAYAIQPASWRQHAPHKAYRLASVPLHADGVALLHLAWLSRSLRWRSFPANPYTLRTECVAYLKRIGQAGNPLRGVTAAQDAEPLPASDLTDMREAGVLSSVNIRRSDTP